DVCRISYLAIPARRAGCDRKCWNSWRLHRRRSLVTPAMKLEERRDQIRQMGYTEPASDVDAALRRALRDRSSLIVAEAAKVARRHRRTPLIEELLSAYD